MESIGQLAGGVAHDFNNMLGGIVGAAELLKPLVDSEKARGHLGTIFDASTRAA